MKRIYISVIIILFTGCIIFYSCGKKVTDFSVTKDKEIWFRNSGISLKFDRNMYCSIYFQDATNPMNEIHGDSVLSKPSHYLVVNGEAVKNFVVDFNNIKTEHVNSSFGSGKRLILTGIAEKKDVFRIEKTLEIEFYPNYPDAAITYASYRNSGTKDIAIDMDYSACFRMDASLFNKEDPPYKFWSFQGSSLDWGKDYIIKIDTGFKQENYMGVQPGTKTGRGVPMIDLWTSKAGLAIAHIETKPKLVSFPVEVGKDNRIVMSMSREVNAVLHPEESYGTPMTRC